MNKMILCMDVIKFLHFNFFSRHVARDKGKYLIPLKGTVLDIRKGAKIVLHGNIFICALKPKGVKEQSSCQLYENSTLTINGTVYLGYGSVIQLHKGAAISIGKATINAYVTMIAEKEIQIGSDVLVGRYASIFDSDFHSVLDSMGNRKNPPLKVNIGNHVWICIKATILRGSTIGDGAVIGAGALVANNVNNGELIGTNRGQSFGLIRWEA